MPISDESLDRLRLAVEDSPSDVRACLALAQALADSGHPDEAASALAAHDGPLPQNDPDIIRDRARLAAQLMPNVDTPLGCAAVARALGEGAQAGVADVQTDMAEALLRLLDRLHIRRSRGDVPLPGGWTATWQDPIERLPAIGRLLRKMSGWLHFLALVLPLGMYGLAFALSAIAKNNEDLSRLERDTGLAVLTAAGLAIVGKIIALVITPGSTKWGWRQAAAMAAAAVGLAALARIGNMMSAPWWLTGFYGTLMGVAFVNFRFWHKFRLRRRQEDRWHLRHPKAAIEVTLVKGIVSEESVFS
jgi:hypothetical protein